MNHYFLCVFGHSAGHAAVVRHVAGQPQPPVGPSDGHARTVCLGEEKHHDAH